MIDTKATDTPVGASRLLKEFIETRSIDLESLEGAFSVAIWDAHRRVGWAACDQLAMQRTYYHIPSDERGVYVSTHALPLGRALGLSGDADGVREFLTRGTLLAPQSLILGVRRFSTGEYLEHTPNEGFMLRRSWDFGTLSRVSTSQNDIVEKFASLITDRITRFAASRRIRRVLVDLTGGYDTRLLLAAMEKCKIEYSCTVNGNNHDPDVVIAKQVAESVGCDILHFLPTEPTMEVTTPVRREFIYRTDGELIFTEMIPNAARRTNLASKYDLHFSGEGGELLRYLPWAHEFLYIGQHRPARAAYVVDRSFYLTRPPANLFPTDWYPHQRNKLIQQIESFCAQIVGDNTLQLDALFLWNGTGRGAQYGSSLRGYLPTVAPMMCAGPVKCMLQIPWRQKLSATTMRHVIASLCPEAARVPTEYGAPATPPTLRTLHWEMRQIGRRLIHLSRRFTPNLAKKDNPDKLSKPYQNEDFFSYMAPDSMISGGMYVQSALKEFLSNPGTWASGKDTFALRVATIEHVFQELDFRPGEDFLSVRADSETIAAREKRVD